MSNGHHQHTGVIPGRLKYMVGDATVPEAGGHRMIIHIVNDEGVWGGGFVSALGKRWPRSHTEYRRWYIARRDFKLGNVLEVNLRSDTTIVHMMAQSGTEPDDEGNPPIRYEALEECLDKVAELANYSGSSVHGPKFGSGLAGGDWDEVEELIIECLIKKGINVTIYEIEDE